MVAAEGVPTATPRGPDAPYQMLFDDQSGGTVLPPAFAVLYSRWPLPAADGRPYVYANFVTSHDGRVSFNIRGHTGGSDISRRNTNDRWLMGLLRARADAILIGSSSLATAGNHVWTPDAVFPDDREAWGALRRAEERSATPLTVIATRSGVISAPEAATFHTPALRVLLATTTAGLTAAEPVLRRSPHVEVYVAGDTLDLAQLLRHLHNHYAVNTLLSEGGPQLYGSLQAAGLINDEFITLSPILVGSRDDQFRPALVEGTAFPYQNPPRSRLLSLHRSGDYLFLHSRYD